MPQRIRLLQPSKPLGCDPERVLHGPGGDTDLDVVDGLEGVRSGGGRAESLYDDTSSD